MRGLGQGISDYFVELCKVKLEGKKLNKGRMSRAGRITGGGIYLGS